MAETYVYPYSFGTAKHDGDVELWKASYQENVACRNAIEQTIRENYNGYHLNADAATKVIGEYGYDRVNWVLANTIQEKIYDGRFSEANKKWAKGFYTPDREGSNRASSYTVETHPAVLDGFIKEARAAYEALGLYDGSHCEGDRENADYDGKVLVLNPKFLQDKYKTPDDQLVLAQGGFGCSPTASGRKVFDIFLKDGEDCQNYRSDFVGILKSELLPDWAREKLDAINIKNAGPSQTEGEAVGMTPSL
jgi:hypothetical protein